MKTSWTCYTGTQSFYVVTTNHIECGWGLELFLFLCFRVCLELQITFFVVARLVVWLRCLAGRLLLSILLISMWDIYHNFLYNRWFSRLAKFLDCKDCYFPSYLSFLTLGQRVVVISCICQSVPIILVNMIIQSVYSICPPNLHGGREEGVEGPKRYIDLKVLNKYIVFKIECL